MRLSGLTAAVILLSSSISLAQHGAPSSPPPSPPPSAAPAPAPPPAPSPAPSAPVVHSAPSPPAPVSAPTSHVAPSVSASPIQGSSPRSPESHEARTAPVAVHAPEPESGRVTSEQNISDEGRIRPALRIGEKPPEEDREGKSPESNLRRPICNGENCKEPPKKPEPPQSDLRRPLCGRELCPCPPGQTAVNGCVVNPAYYQNQCQAGEFWNGSSCLQSQAQCANINGVLQNEIFELRAVRAEVQHHCSLDSNSPECRDAKIRQEDALLRYRQTLNSADPACRGGWAEDPL